MLSSTIFIAVLREGERREREEERRREERRRERRDALS